MKTKGPSLESLRAEEARLDNLVTQRKGQLFAGNPCHDLASLAERLSEVRKEIASRALCQMFTA